MYVNSHLITEAAVGSGEALIWRRNNLL